MNWKWDQGRLHYFQFDNLKAIAHTLVQFDGVDIRAHEKSFRDQLENNTELPFAPREYTVLRNYKRVFECAFLATVNQGHVLCSDTCREMAKTNSNLSYVDDYFAWYIPHFRYPFPAFSDYAQTTQRVYPLCAVLKYLLARLEHGSDPKISVDDTLRLLIANNCTGYEDVNYFLTLTPGSFDVEQKRQVRELLIFVSQMSIFKMYGDYLYLDVVKSEDTLSFLHTISTPLGAIEWSEKSTEFTNQTSIGSKVHIPEMTNTSFNADDIEFTEGKRKRVEHIKIERSPLLRKYYITQHPEPVCNMCTADMRQRYPWTTYLLEIHHLLPLSSTLIISTSGTSLNDIVGLCPSCHRSLHIYYKQWLDAHNQDDFSSKEEVKDIYVRAMKEIIV